MRVLDDIAISHDHGPPFICKFISHGGSQSIKLLHIDFFEGVPQNVDAVKPGQQVSQFGILLA